MVAARYNLGCSSDVDVGSSCRGKGEEVWTTTDTAKARRPQHFVHGCFHPPCRRACLTGTAAGCHVFPLFPGPKWRGSSGLPHRNGRRIRSPGGRSPPGTATSESAQAGRSCPETLDWLPFNSSSGNFASGTRLSASLACPSLQSDSPLSMLELCSSTYQHPVLPSSAGTPWALLVHVEAPSPMLTTIKQTWAQCHFELTACERAEHRKGARWD